MNLGVRVILGRKICWWARICTSHGGRPVARNWGGPSIGKALRRGTCTTYRSASVYIFRHHQQYHQNKLVHAVKGVAHGRLGKTLSGLVSGKDRKKTVKERDRAGQAQVAAPRKTIMAVDKTEKDQRRLERIRYCQFPTSRRL